MAQRPAVESPQADWHDLRVRPLFSYYGGKQRIASWIAEAIRAIPHLVYVEPFAGGAAVLYAKGTPTELTNYSEVLNDLDFGVYTLFKVARERPSEFAAWVLGTPYSQEDYRRAVAIRKNPSGYDELTVAWATYVSQNQAFGNRLGGGLGHGYLGAESGVPLAEPAAIFAGRDASAGVGLCCP